MTANSARRWAAARSAEYVHHPSEDTGWNPEDRITKKSYQEVTLSLAVLRQGQAAFSGITIPVLACWFNIWALMYMFLTEKRLILIQFNYISEAEFIKKNGWLR